MMSVAPLPRFEPSTFAEQAHRFFSPCYTKSKAEAFAQKIIARLNPAGGNAALIRLADRFITTYCDHKILGKIAKVLDRTIGRFPLTQDGVSRYLHPANKEGFEKWCDYDMPAEIYINFPDFCNWVESSRLLSQMKIFRRREGCPIQMHEDEPAIYVTLEKRTAPRLMKWSELEEIFDTVKKKEFKEIFIYRKDHTTDYIPSSPPEPTVYSWLPNGAGLQPFHPYYTGKKPGEKLTPTARLSKAEYTRTLDTARKYIRPKEAELSPEDRRRANKKRTYILQVVTPYVKKGNSNFHELYSNRRHPCLRIITGKKNSQLKTKKREVFEIGYWWRRAPGKAFISHQGWFRSPDKWSYLPQDESVVANFAITRKEAQRVFKFTMNYHRDHHHDTGFQILYQNCTTYVRQACRTAGIELPTLIYKKDFLIRILPDWIKAIGRGLAQAYRGVATCFHTVYSRLPEGITHPITKLSKLVTDVVSRIIEWTLSFIVLPLRAAYGGAQGNGGREFDTINALVDTPAEEGRIDPPLRHLRRWFTFWSEPIDMPGTIPDFTRSLPSTIVFPKTDSPEIAIATPEE